MADPNFNRARLHLTIALDDVGVLNILLPQADTHKCICFFKFMNFKRCLGTTNSESGIEASVQVFDIISHRVLQRAKRCGNLNVMR